MRVALFIVPSVLSLALLLVGCKREEEAAAPPPDRQSGPPIFRDVTAAAKIDFTYRNGEEAGHYAILESLGGGVALFDFDGDGLLDLYVPGGGYFEKTAQELEKLPQGKHECAIRGYPGKLYRNLGNLQFEDVTAAVLKDQAVFYSHGCAVADYDRDGWPDLLVTGWGRVALYHNEPADPKDPSKGRRLVDVTAKAGLSPITWATSAAFADIDGDGYADLYICQYVNWSFRNHPKCAGYAAGIQQDVCPPRQFLGLPHLLFHNQANGTFQNISEAAGLSVDGVVDADGRPVDVGKGLGVVAADLNGDGRPDFYVANDTVDNFLYLNRGNLKFAEVGLVSGVARDDRGVPNGSMGVDVADYDGSGHASIFVTNYENEMHALYRNLGKKEIFLYSTPASGIARLGQQYVGFGTAFVDLDHDGWEDLVIINGHVIRHPGPAGLKQSPVILRNEGTARFTEITHRGGEYFQKKHIGRGLAVGDLDNDGRPDLVISHVNEPLTVLRNIANEEKRPHWLGIELVGKKFRDLVGSTVVLQVNGRKLTRFIKGGGSYLCASDPRLVFGLGDQPKATRLSVSWCHGPTQHLDLADVAVDGYWRIVEGEDRPRPWGRK